MRQAAVLIVLTKTEASRVSLLIKCKHRPRSFEKNNRILLVTMEIPPALRAGNASRKTSESKEFVSEVTQELNGAQQEVDVERYYEILYDAPNSALISAALGALIGGNLVFLLICRPQFFQLPLYVVALSTFHFMEYYVTAKYNSSRVSVDSFLFNNGKAYNIAHGVAMTEALIEWYCCPLSGKWRYVSMAGFVLAVFGQLVRSLAMIQAASNFSHVIVRSREPDHQLVQSGVYAFSRHPSYCGFFYWAVGLQILLLNPVSLLGFIVVLWRFFNSRIQDEEAHLIVFFGKDYVHYRERIPTRIPFIA